jgi:hypothetical protein
VKEIRNKYNILGMKSEGMRRERETKTWIDNPVTDLIRKDYETWTEKKR